MVEYQIPMEQENMLNLMLLEDESTWPAKVIAYLNGHSDIFLNWELGNYDKVSSQEYDNAIDGLRDALQTNDVLRGYHCTRLTNLEIQHILKNGMQLPNRELLHQRINSLEQAGLITNEVAEHLTTKNQANDANRAGRLWFCFYPPYLAGQNGIERLFRSWGGEALYNSHERDSFSGPILAIIGTPCIIESLVPIANLAQRRMDSNIIRRYLINRGLQITDSLDYEDYVRQAIPQQNISRIIEFPSADFTTLTKCDTWKPPLSI